MKSTPLALIGITGAVVGAAPADASNDLAQTRAARAAAIHPVANGTTMRAWLGRVPQTRAFPPDFAGTLRGDAPAFVIEMTTAPTCLPCADLWAKLQTLGRQYGFRIAVLPREESMVRSGRLGLPWVGHPVVWVRANADPARVIPIAIGTDHSVNLSRNIYLAFKMMTGVRPDVGVRAMAKFTGIVGVSSASPAPTPRQ